MLGPLSFGRAYDKTYLVRRLFFSHPILVWKYACEKFIKFCMLALRIICAVYILIFRDIALIENTGKATLISLMKQPS